MAFSLIFKHLIRTGLLKPLSFYIYSTSLIQQDFTFKGSNYPSSAYVQYGTSSLNKGIISLSHHSR